MSILVTHKFHSTKSDSSDITLVNPSNWNDSHVVTGLSTASASDYNFQCQTPGINLVIGSNNILMSPMPLGMAIGNSVYISGGVGVAEAAVITGVLSNSIIVTCTYTHSGAYSICSATCGIQETIASFPVQGGMCIVDTNCTLHANVTDLGKTAVMVTRMPQSVITSNNFTIMGGVPSTYGREQVWMNNPNWDALHTLYNGIQFDMGGYPDTHMYSFATGPCVQALVGSVMIKGSTGSTPIPLISGVSGYAETAVTKQSAVGIMGAGNATGTGQFAWGGNIMCGNGVNNSADLTGSALYGLEVDTNLSAGHPPILAVGVAIVGNMITTANDSKGCAISVNPSTLPWARAYLSEDGCSAIGLELGTTTWSNIYPAQSQPIVLNTRSTTNDARTNLVFADQFGDLILSTGKSYISGNTYGSVIIDIQASSGAAPGSVQFPDTGGMCIKPTTFVSASHSAGIGTICTISDSTTATPGAIVAGGGSNLVAALWNGTNWIVL